MPGRYKVANKEDRTADGIVFDSRAEMLAYCNQFRPLMQSGIKVELQKRFALFAAVPETIPSNGHFDCHKVCEYIADFVVTEKDGSLRIYDVKGHVNALYALKRKLFHACYPHLRIVEI